MVVFFSPGGGHLHPHDHHSNHVHDHDQVHHHGHSQSHSHTLKDLSVGLSILCEYKGFIYRVPIAVTFLCSLALFSEL